VSVTCASTFLNYLIKSFHAKKSWPSITENNLAMLFWERDAFSVKKEEIFNFKADFIYNNGCTLQN
jgi:hypothetical protein